MNTNLGYIRFGQNRRAVVAISLVLGFITPLAYAQLLPTNMVGVPGSAFYSAEDCGECHTKQYNEWRSSMMSYSSISPPIHALELTENHMSRDPDGDGVGGPHGRFARTPDAKVGELHDEPQLFCQKCHAPVAVFTDVFGEVEDFDFEHGVRGDFPDSHVLLQEIAGDSEIDQLQRDNARVAYEEGITCTVCHRINGQELSNVFPRPEFEPGVANSAYLIEHVIGFQRGTVYGPYLPDELDPPLSPRHLVDVTGETANDDKPYVGNDGVERAYIQTGEFCGSCHDVRIPFQDVETLEPFRRVENLFTEWRDSPWNNNNELIYVEENPRELAHDDDGNEIKGKDGNALKSITTCQDCHMSLYMLDPGAKPGEYAGGFFADGAEERERVSNHRFMGVDRFLVRDLPDDTNALVLYDISEISESDLATEEFEDLRDVGLDVDNRPIQDLREVLLQRAIDFKIKSAKAKRGILTVEISVENVGAGHNVPAGLSQERQVWIELEVLDKKGNHVFTSGYLTPLEETTELFDPRGSVRYKDSYCGEDEGLLEYECDLDSFRAKLNNSLDIMSIEDGDDRVLVNYQNGFTLDGDKVFSQFIGNAIDNENSLKPFEPKIERYEILVDSRDKHFTINARLRFRPLPHEFLNALKWDGSTFGTSRVTKDVIKRNVVSEMEQDSCVTGGQGKADEGRCP
jgi:hypothetical protein